MNKGLYQLLITLTRCGERPYSQIYTVGMDRIDHAEQAYQNLTGRQIAGFDRTVERMYPTPEDFVRSA